MASTSTEIVNRTDLVGSYQVFLSFRGIDTRHGFTDHLYHNLVGAGIHTFRDDNELRVGEEISPKLIKAIKYSKILIPIFSKNYADSKWCLRELALMVECWENWGQKIFPIFYDVQPFEVQHYERGSYNTAFGEYEDDLSLNQKRVDQWKNICFGYSWRVEGVGIEEREGYSTQFSSFLMKFDSEVYNN